MTTRPESHAAPEIDRLLRAAAAASDEPERDGRGRVVATDAVWFCACETPDAWETWVVHSVGADGLGWLRFADAREFDDVLVADRLVGLHPDPQALLRWLGGDEPDPWQHMHPEVWASGVVAELHRRVRLARPTP